MNKFGSFDIKIALAASGLLIVGLILFYTQHLATKIQQREKQIAGLYARSLEYLANAENETGEYTFIFEEIITQIDFPIIATDKDYKTITFFKNVDFDSTKGLSSQDSAKFFAMAKEMSEINDPIAVKYVLDQDTLILSYVHYGQSGLVTELKLLPYMEFLIAGLFVFLGYIGFSYIKKNEQSSIWVGLSRETAHQLGTPLSSLMGWTEMLKNVKPGSGELEEVTSEIEKDLEKLNKIAGRFSKIGSQPLLKSENLKEAITHVVNYIEKRIPTLTTIDGKPVKKVKINIEGDDNICANINTDLFEWVIENLLKNSLDAMDKPSGEISIKVYTVGHEAVIDVTDSGKGVDMKHKKDIFRPGYSTKQRGWGLGLSLSKRIIEDYHSGKFFLLDSAVGKGATFRIKLNKDN
ncbi:MAG: HAMP domain-containing histidine kinase [Ignavibacteriae bacterium]|nr:HAMP domain-containing histidine kinase [Ignavibacteriota bacterium]MCB9244161.1 HAMP domain-containing histidine kinase [Ignavibacteriales bacterium]